MKKLIINFLFAVFAGISLFLAAPPTNLWFLIFLALPILWNLVKQGRVPAVILFSFVYGFTYFFFLFDWAEASAKTIIARIALAFLETVFIVLLALFWKLWQRLIQPQTFLFQFIEITGAAFLWVFVEQLRSAYPFGGMPWGLLGFSLVDSPFISFAPYGSTQLVGFIAVLFALSLGSIFLSLRAAQVFSASAFGLVAVLIMGLSLLPGKTDFHGVETVQVAVVQGNIEDAETLQPDDNRALIVTQNHVTETLKLLRDNPKATEIDFIVWPESASDYDLREDAEVQEILQPLVMQLGEVPLLLGTQKYFADDTARTNDYVLFQQGKVVQSYSKQHPVPFGEYLPFRSFIEQIAPEAKKIVTDMVPGNRSAYLEVPLKNLSGENLKIATPICFEVADNLIVADGAKGSGLLLVPTNNASFGDTGEPWQQFAMTRFRAVETGKSAIQVSTAGTSGAVTPDGREIYRTGLFEADARVVELPLVFSDTLATKTAVHRQLLINFFGVFLLIGAIIGIRIRKITK